MRLGSYAANKPVAIVSGTDVSLPPGWATQAWSPIVTIRVPEMVMSRATAGLFTVVPR